MPEIDKYKKKKLIIKQKTKDFVMNNIINKSTNDNGIKSAESIILLRKIKNKDTIQLNIETKISFWLKILISIILYFPIVSNDRKIKISTLPMKSGQNYKIINFKFTACPSNIRRIRHNNQAFSLTNSGNCIYSDTKIIKSDTEQSLYFKPDQDESSNTFQFEWQ